MVTHPSLLPLDVAVPGWLVGLFKGHGTSLEEQPCCFTTLVAAASFKRLMGAGINLELQLRPDHLLLHFPVADMIALKKLGHTI